MFIGHDPQGTYYLDTEYFQAETFESSATVIHLVGSRTTANLCLCRFKRSLCRPR